MIIISEKLINNYINGEDTNPYTLDELENDMDFMKAVVAKTKDKKMINFCSDELKRNPEFVMYVVKKLRNDKKFIYDYSIDCLKNMLNDKKYNANNLLMSKFCLLMISLFNDFDENMIFQLTLGIIYKKFVSQLIIAKSMNPQYENAFGYGFYLMYDAFHSDDEVVSFYAKRVLKNIIDDHGDEIIKLLHKDFKKFEDIKNISFICMNYLQGYDEMLISYLSGHIEPFNDVMAPFFRSLKNKWESYYEHIEFEKYMELFDKIHDFWQCQYNYLLYNEDDILLYMGKKLGIIDKIIKYGFTSLGYGEEYLRNFEEREEEIDLMFRDDLTGKFIYDRLESIINETIYGANTKLLAKKSFDEKK